MDHVIHHVRHLSPLIQQHLCAARVLLQEGAQVQDVSVNAHPQVLGSAVPRELIHSDDAQAVDRWRCIWQRVWSGHGSATTHDKTRVFSDSFSDRARSRRLSLTQKPNREMLRVAAGRQFVLGVVITVVTAVIYVRASNWRPGPFCLFYEWRARPPSAVPRPEGSSNVQR